MTARRPAIRDTVLDTRTETYTHMFLVVRWQCGRCSNVWESSHDPEVGVKTSTCKRCGRTCRIDNAILPEVTPW
jgi:hypothetical protein